MNPNECILTIKMSKTYCVVSVEDDPDLFQLISVTLRTLPIQLHHAKNGNEALELIPKVDADLVILDINLPDIHGWNVLKEMEQRNIDPKNVIVLTAMTSATHRVIAHLQEVIAYIPKPFKPQELRELVRETLGLE